MAQLLGLIILSAFITIILLIPFIDFLYRIKLRRKHQLTKDFQNNRTHIFDKFNTWKVGTPFGGGILIILVVVAITLWSYVMLGIVTNPWENFVIIFTFVGFGLLGLYDDIKKLTNVKTGFFGLRIRYKLILQFIIALIVSVVLFYQLGYSTIYIHGIRSINLSYVYIPFAALIIVSFANAFNITDGLDGLAPGLFLICLLAFLAITSSSYLDKSLGIFIAVLIGSVAAFLYFNVYRARIWLGDVGSMSLGASLAIIGLLTDKTLALAVIGGFFVFEVASSLLQLLSKRFLKKKLFTVAPLHLYLLHRGWEEPKIVMRAWLIGFFFAVLGLYLALGK